MQKITDTAKPAASTHSRIKVANKDKNAKVDIPAAKQKAISLVENWLLNEKNGKLLKDSTEIQCQSPFRNDKNPSFTFNIENGKGCDHGDSDKGYSSLDILSASRGNASPSNKDIVHLAREVLGENKGPDIGKAKKSGLAPKKTKEIKADNNGVPFQGTREQAIEAFKSSHKVADTDILYVYMSRSGKSVLAIKTRTKDKKFFQFRYNGNKWETGAYKYEGQTPLYNQHKLAKIDKGDTVIICEGEKCCDYLSNLGYIAVTYGSSAQAGYASDRKTSKCDFSSIPKHSKIIIWADADDKGQGDKAAQLCLEQLKDRIIKPIWTISGELINEIFPHTRKISGADAANLTPDEIKTALRFADPLERLILDYPELESWYGSKNGYYEIVEVRDGHDNKTKILKAHERTAGQLKDFVGEDLGIEEDPALYRKIKRFLATRRQVDGAMSYAFAEGDTFIANGDNYINTCNSRVIQPSKDESITLDDIPEYKAYLDRFLTNNPGELERERYISMLKLAYENALNYNPSQLPAFIIAGPTGCGKSYGLEVILSKLVGGHCNPEDYLKSETSFNGEFAESRILIMSDAIFKPLISKVSGDTAFTGKCKNLIASDQYRIHAKREKPIMLPIGALFITTNMDTVSLKAGIPDLSQTFRDKVIVIRCREDYEEFPEPKAGELGENELMLTSEYLAKIGRALINYKIPEEIAGGRFQLRPYINRKLDSLVEKSSFDGAAPELLKRLGSFAMNDANREFLRSIGCYFSKGDKNVTGLPKAGIVRYGITNQNKRENTDDFLILRSNQFSEIVEQFVRKTDMRDGCFIDLVESQIDDKRSYFQREDNVKQAVETILYSTSPKKIDWQYTARHIKLDGKSVNRLILIPIADYREDWSKAIIDNWQANEVGEVYFEVDEFEQPDPEIIELAKPEQNAPESKHTFKFDGVIYESLKDPVKMFFKESGNSVKIEQSDKQPSGYQPVFVENYGSLRLSYFANNKLIFNLVEKRFIKAQPLSSNRLDIPSLNLGN